MITFGIIDDFVGEMRMQRYSEHAYSLHVSPRFLYHNFSKHHLPINQMILSSFSKESFDKKVRFALANHGHTDFYDFSLALGTIMGVYNVYLYQFLSEHLKKQLASQPCRFFQVKKFLCKYDGSFIKYFGNFYGIDKDEYHGILSRMFYINSDESLYANPVCLDVGKILITSSLLFHSIDSNDFKQDISFLISSGQMVDDFKEMNQGVRCYKNKQIR